MLVRSSNGNGLLRNEETGGLATAVPQSIFGGGVFGGSEHITCCGGKCNCMCNKLPSSWTLEFHDCIREQACLNGMTFEIDRESSDPPGTWSNCSGCVLGNPICATETGRVRSICVHMGNTGSTFMVSIGMESDQVFFGIPPTTWNGTYLVSGGLANDPSHHAQRQDCRNQSGTITNHGWLTYFSTQFLEWGFSCDITPHE